MAIGYLTHTVCLIGDTVVRLSITNQTGCISPYRLAYEEALLEASLNGTREMELEEESRLQQQNETNALIRKSESRTSLFGRKSKKAGNSNSKAHQSRRDSRGHSLPRGDSSVRFNRQYSSNRVADRGKEMF